MNLCCEKILGIFGVRRETRRMQRTLLFIDFGAFMNCQFLYLVGASLIETLLLTRSFGDSHSVAKE